MKNILLSIAVMFSLLGCAVTPPILKAGESKSYFEDAVYAGETNIISKDVKSGEQYRVFIQAATGFIPASVCREEAEQKAVHFCE